MRVGFLTAPLLRKEREYPFADLPQHVKPIIVRALETAWERIVDHVERHGGALIEEGERTITARLAQALDDIQTEPDHPSGFSASQFQNVVRDAAVMSYDDKSLEKRPDLAFRLISIQPGLERSADYGLFVECKIVGPSHPVRDYCKKGLFRFVCGEYAWAMPCGMMVGYAWEGFTVESELSSYLGCGGARDMNLRFSPRLVPALAGSFPLYESGHGRTWTRNGKSHGDIAILHLWLPLRRGAQSQGISLPASK
jgi:hypothetical protein